jgi:hypothetical protein
MIPVYPVTCPPKWGKDMLHDHLKEQVGGLVEIVERRFWFGVHE